MPNATDIYAIKVHHPARRNYAKNWTYPGHEDWLNFKGHDLITTAPYVCQATTYSHATALEIAKNMNDRYHGDPKLTAGHETYKFTPVRLTKMQLLVDKLVAAVMT